MLKYILKRFFISIIVLLGVSIIIYTLVRMMPESYIDIKFKAMLGNGVVDENIIKFFKDLYGLSDNSPMGIIKGYFNWLTKALQLELGTSFMYSKPVASIIADKMWISFAIAAAAMIFQFIIAIPLGISSATHQYSARDYTATVLTMMGISLPTFFFATMVIIVFALKLGWFPSQGLTDATRNYASNFEYYMDMLYHLILPMFVMVILSLGGLMRYTRTNMLEVLNADYIRTARAKGLSEKTVIYKHAFRNTMIPVVTMLAGVLPGLFGGAMITEQVFAIPGIGQIAYNAMRNADIPFIMGYNMFLAILTIIGTLLSDLMYAVVDPRVKIGK